MKPLKKFAVLSNCILIVTATSLIWSCKKSKLEGREGSSLTNHAPVANAGTDTTVNLYASNYLPGTNAFLDGRASSDPDNNIAAYAWRKISGPYPNTVLHSDAAQTEVIDLEEGIYQFELKVTDDRGLSSRDTMNINVQLKEFTYNDINWRVDSVNNMVYLQTALLPANHMVRKVFMFDLFPVWGGWFELQRDGTTPDVLYYKIVNSTVIAYLYYSPTTDLSSIFNWIDNDVKVQF